ncbi:MAG: CHAT domain-containing protein, partial [Chloroflexota bacterium]
MNDAYYTYRINLINYNRVQAEVRNPQNQPIRQPSGLFNYKGALKEEIDALVAQAQADAMQDDEAAKALGEALFNALFDAGLRADFSALYNQAVHVERKFLRVELDVDEAALPDIAALPWEFMRLPVEANLGTLWLSTAPDLIFSRRRSQWHIPNPIQLAPHEKLRIALAVAAPSDLGPVVYEDVEKGLKKLVETTTDKFEFLPVVTAANAERIDALLAQNPHIFHFIGHGQLVEENGKTKGQIAFVDDIFGEASWVDEDFFSDLLNTHRPGIVLLQACEGGQSSASKAFVGVASRVVQQNIPVV